MRLLLAAVCGLLSLSVGCTTVWVAPTGNDGAAGTETAPKRTLAGACAVPRDSEGRLIVMKAGVYPEQRIGCDRTLVVEDGQATIRATGPSSTDPVLDIPGSDIEVRGVQVDSAAVQRKGVHVSGPRVRLTGMDIGNTLDDKAIEATGPDFQLTDSTVHDARYQNPEAHLECLFAHETDRIVIRGNVFRNCAVYDVAFTRCVWCSPVPPPARDGVIEGNQFFHSHQCCDLASWHYTELAFYSFMGEVRGFTVRNNWFETRSDGRGGVLLEPPWVDGIRCGNTEGPVQGVIGAEWKQPC